MERTAGLHRSYLYALGYREDHIEKAYASKADAVVLELEDAVAPSKKDAARATVSAFLDESPPKPTFVRINPPGSDLTWRDLETIGRAEIEGIRIAKVDRPEDVRVVGGWLDELGSVAGIQLLLETAAAVENAVDLLEADARVIGAGLGEQDLAADVGASGDEALLYPRSRLVFASRAAGVHPPFASVWTDLSDEDGLRASCHAARRLGFFGRSAIHPRQIDPINEAFTPTAEEIEEAEEITRLLADSIDAGAAGFRLPDGRFVDRAVALAAQRTQALSRRAEEAAATPKAGR